VTIWCESLANKVYSISAGRGAFIPQLMGL
jgi:hypothetical protein